MKIDTTESLRQELDAFCDERDLPKQCAEELALDSDLSDKDCEWLRNFCERWETAEKREDNLFVPVSSYKATNGLMYDTRDKAIRASHLNFASEVLNYSVEHDEVLPEELLNFLSQGDNLESLVMAVEHHRNWKGDQS